MRKMWKIYSLGWIAYAGLIAVVVQIEDVTRGKFSFAEAFSAFASTLPAPLMLALIWPLSGYLERRRAAAGQVVGIHVAAALAFGVGLHVLNYVIFRELLGIPNDRPLLWYVWPFLYSLMMYGVIAAVFHVIRASAAARRQELAMAQAHSLLTAAELSALRNKLNPHFLFNTLHSIIALVRKDALAAEAALFRFSDMLRYILDTEKSGSERVTLQEELQFVRDYLELEALRLGARLHINWDLDSQADRVPVPALSIQPLVENSIKHAFNPRSQPGRLCIRSHLNAAQRRLEIQVADDGPGADMAGIGNASGMGIRTVERRLRLEYGDQAGFQIQTAPGAGFAVNLSLPLETA